MKFRGGAHEDSAFDGLTAEEVRRIRGAAMANVTPGMEGLARKLRPPIDTARCPDPGIRDERTPKPTRKRGRRA